jgi:ATP:cob(I)alamin adenosyltransferase
VKAIVADEVFLCTLSFGGSLYKFLSIYYLMLCRTSNYILQSHVRILCGLPQVLLHPETHDRGASSSSQPIGGSSDSTTADTRWNMSSGGNNILEIEEIHKIACQQGSATYIDPKTGFNVFTEISHLKRGTCCGNQCRHCPYGWENVPDTNLRRAAKVQSGDRKAIEARLHEIQVGTSKQACSSSAVDNEPGKPTANSQAKRTGGRHGGNLTSKNVPYTRGGDKGSSSLLTGERRSKADDAFEAMGTVDELCSVVGVCHAELKAAGIKAGPLEDWTLEIMSRLFDIGSHVAKPRKVDGDETRQFTADGVGGGFDERHIEELEDWIDIMTEQIPELTSFILPTGSKAASHLHVARTVCRRAERRVVPLTDASVCDPNVLRYLNRLSDFFFTAARFLNHMQGCEEILYRKPTRYSKQRSRYTIAPIVHNDDS